MADSDTKREWSFISFNGTGVRFSLGHDADPKERRRSRLYYDVKLDPRNPIKLAEGSPIEATRLGIGIEPIAREDEDAGSGEIGIIGYTAPYEEGAFRFPQTISADLGVPQAVFEELVLAARQGRCPGEITLAVEGLKPPGFSGNEFAWDNAETGKRFLSIRGVTFSVNFVSPLEDEGKAVSVDVLPPTPGQFQAAKQGEAIARRVGSITMLLALLLVLIFGMLLWQLFR